MDEILFPAPGGAVERRAPARPDFAQRREELLRRYDELMFRWDHFRQTHKLRPKWFLAAALTLGVVSTATLYTPGYAVLVDGQEVGVVASKAQVQTVRDQVEDRVSRVLGRDYTLDNTVTCRWRVVNKRDLSSLSGELPVQPRLRGRPGLRPLPGRPDPGHLRQQPGAQRTAGVPQGPLRQRKHHPGGLHRRPDPPLRVCGRAPDHR